MADTQQLDTPQDIPRDLHGLRRSPASLLHEAFVAGSTAGVVELSEVEFLTMAGVRVDPGSAEGQRIAAVTGGLPSRCGDVAGDGVLEAEPRNGAGTGSNGTGTGTGTGSIDSTATSSGLANTSALWLGPTEFLVVAPPEAHETLVPSLVEALADGQGQVVDLSANRTTFELTGPRARAVLEKGCSLDLHPRIHPAGTALSTEVGGIPVILWKTAESTYRILPRASFATFLGHWLLDAMREYASPEVP
ncbi:sarcosine oxidase subunit gamma [Arthrobacter crusticola]|uniref:Sarcosine oxidase subunit gamma n=1 Tax=Arthrobacter crusticola TaxID=2547960 RepID=A0A4R5TZ71_9MICC|nr:sarcosine oxidase subunit gamma family protein [Arthrobacter crusticola]TDK26577.1 sarcosine oxidase subunit gamma [Arthrobacter crusticola]